MSLSYVSINENLDDLTGTPIPNGVVYFTPTQSVYFSGIPVAQVDEPITAQIVNGRLQTLNGGTVQLLATDNTGMTVTTRTGFFLWQVSIVVAGATPDGWMFELPSLPSSVDLYALAGTGLGGTVNSVTAGDASIVVGGTAANPTVETGTFDQVASLHPAAGNVTLNGHKATNAANATAGTDLVTLGQLGSAAFQASSAFDAAGAAAAAQAASDPLGSATASAAYFLRVFAV